MNFEELQNLLFGQSKYDRLINEFRWEDNNLHIWVYTFNIEEFLQHFKFMVDGTNHIDLHWVGDSICIEHFEDWLPDIDETELFALFPCD